MLDLPTAAVSERGETCVAVVVVDGATLPFAGRHRAHVGGREEQARRALVDHAQQAAEEAGPGPLLAGDRTFATRTGHSPSRDTLEPISSAVQIRTAVSQIAFSILCATVFVVDREQT